jgi:hypothetical protein
MTQREIYQHDVKWMTLENESGTATLSQHGYIEEGEGNKALCCRAFAAADDETPMKFSLLKGERMKET